MVVAGQASAAAENLEDLVAAAEDLVVVAEDLVAAAEDLVAAAASSEVDLVAALVSVWTVECVVV